MKRMLLSFVVVWAAAVAGADVVNPLKRENAPDPFTTYDAASGWYYHIHSDNPTDGSGGFTADRVVLHRSREAGRLLNADESRVVYRADAADGVFGYLWAPEMHRAPNGKWYVYTSCTRKKEGGDKRLLVLEAKTDDPFDGFVVKSFPDESAFAIDPTVFTASDGLQYICYSQVKAGKGQVLQIREMTNPWTFGPRQAELAIADLPWELVPPYDKAMILEGAFFVRGKTPDALSIVYSANGCWSQGYCLGVLDYQGGDLCDAKSWRKRPQPVFKSGNGVFGPGHASFFRSPDGTELWVSYHFLSHANPTHLPADRLFALQRFNVDAAHGLPAETAPVRPGDRQAEPSAATETTGFGHELKGDVKPWTSEAFLDDPQEFHFAIVSDRTGGERKGFFEKGIDSINLLRPEFVMSVGDLVDGRGASETELRRQWDEAEGFIGKLKMPFFHVVGNHDIWTGFTGMTPARQTSINLWKELHGTNTYYSFTYKGCLFLCLDVMERHDYFPPREPLPQHQIDWALGEIEKHPKARWRFIFMHKPIDWTSDRWLAFERKINKYDYTVFCGDWHNHCTAVRHGKKYYMIGTTGGGFDCGVKSDDLRYGIMDSITWVTMTEEGPVVANLALAGIYGDTVQTCATTQGWIETPLDYPSHLAEDPALYKDETNTALIPAEVMHGPGYDWHFRHAVILRQGKVYGSGLEKFEEGKRRVVLLGDETASAAAADYADAQVFDFGFKGDRIENVLWRVQQGELKGYDPQLVVISVGGHNRGRNSADEIAAAKRKLVDRVRVAVPKAEIKVLGE